MKHFLSLSILLSLSMAVYAQTNTNPQKDKVTAETGQQVGPVFPFSEELEEARRRFEDPNAVPADGARVSDNQEYRKRAYLRKLNEALALYVNDSEKIKIINDEIRRVEAIK